MVPVLSLLSNGAVAGTRPLVVLSSSTGGRCDPTDGTDIGTPVGTGISHREIVADAEKSGAE